jgi:SSS family transporter
MNREIFSFKNIILLFLLVSPVMGKTEKIAQWDWKAASGYPTSESLRGAYVGRIEGKIILAGGLRSDNDQEENYQSRIYTLKYSKENKYSWRSADVNLPNKMAFGAAASTPLGMVILGGRDANGFLDDVFLLTNNEDKSGFEIKKLPSLPISCSRMASCYWDGTVYVAGGKNEDGALNDFWALRRKEKNTSWTEAKWQSLKVWLGPARFDAMMQVQFNGTEERLFLFGGQNASEKLSSVYSYDPLHIESKKSWRKVAEMPQFIGNPGHSVCGQSHILFWGENLQEYPSATLENIKSCNKIFAYHTITNSWASFGEIPEKFCCDNAIKLDESYFLLGQTPEEETYKPSSYEVIIPSAKSRFAIADYVMLIIYLISLAGIGFYFARRQKTTEDYFLGGHRIPWWAAGLSMMATQVSAIGFIAIPAKTYSTDWLYFPGILTWFVVIPVVTIFFMPFFRQLNVTTAYEYLEIRFNVGVRLIVSLLFVLFHLGRMAIVLFLPAMALSAVTGLNEYACIIIMGSITTVYTVAGGMETIIWTDVIQALVLVGGALVCTLLVMFSVENGPSGFFSLAFADNKFNMIKPGWDPRMPVLWVILVGNVFSRVSTLTADQAVVQRYLTTKNIRESKRALWADAAASIPWAVIVFMFGTAVYVFYKTNPASLSPVIDTDGIVPLFISQQLPMGVSGLVIAAIFAASMSSLDSSMHSTTTVIITDFYDRIFGNKNSDKDSNNLLSARIVTVLLGTFATLSAMYIASANIKSLWDLFIQIMGLVMGPMAGVFLLGIISTRTRGISTILGLFIGSLVLGIVEWCTEINFFLYSTIGVLACCISGYLFSLIIPEHEKNIDGITIYTMKKNIKL